MSSTEKRRFSRIPFNATTHVDNGDTRSECELLDISLKGALLKRPEVWAGSIGKECTLSIHLSDEEPTITMQARLAHEDQERLGFSCQHIDLDSMSHLKRLVELNLGDEELLNRELSALVDMQETAS